jgi:ribonuclease HI
MDGSSFVQGRQQKARFTVTTVKDIVQAEALQGWSAQRDELWALVQALRYAKGKQVNIYTDSKHAFATLHVHGAIDKERGLLTAEGKEIKSKEEILQLLEAIWEQPQVAVMLCRGHQRGMDCVSRGNSLADQVARRAAEELSSLGVLEQTTKLLLALELPPILNYTKEEEQWVKDEKRIKEKGGWWKLPDQRLFIPSAVAAPLLKQQHKLMHLGKMTLEKLLDRYYCIPKLPSLCAQVLHALHMHETM